MSFKFKSHLLALCGALLFAPGLAWAATLTAQALDAGPVVIDTAAGTYTAPGGVATPYAPGDTIQITQATPGAVTNTILVTGGGTVAVELDGVNIDVSATPNALAFDIQDANTTVNLTLVGASTLKSGTDAAGLSAPAGTTLTIDGAGSLTADGGSGAAGIGGNISVASGAITIDGGTITANGGWEGAGIGGGGDGGDADGITINGGTVTAIGDRGGAGIGSGAGANSYGSIVINNDASVTATGGSGVLPGIVGGGAGIGSGGSLVATPNAVGSMTIDSINVTATGGTGSGGYGDGSPIGEGGYAAGGNGAGFSSVTLANAPAVSLGDTATLTCDATLVGTTLPPFVNYAWAVSVDKGVTWNPVIGATTDTLSVPGVTAAMIDDNRYTCSASTQFTNPMFAAPVTVQSPVAKLTALVKASGATPIPTLNPAMLALLALCAALAAAASRMKPRNKAD